MPSLKIAPQSSYPRARSGLWVTVCGSVLLALVGGTALASEDTRTRFDIPAQAVEAALTEFAEQADLTLVFPDELVRGRKANELIGRYSLQEGIDLLLAGTGLSPTFSNEVVLSISSEDASASEGDTMKATKKAGLVAVLAGVLAGGVEAQEPGKSESEIRTGVVTGKVTDARTGANLKGAIVAIEETGQSTATNDLGEYRLVNVPQGLVTVTVSYLGYAGQSSEADVRGPTVAQSFTLRGADEIEEIVVFGQRSARAQALNQERASENVASVVSSDLLDQFPARTISEALSRTPGIAFQRSAGEGANVIVRGVGPELNTVKLNGIELPVGDGGSRSASLNNLLADSVSKVTVNKSLLPSQDSAGIGGLVEIETKTPLDRPDRFASFQIEQGLTGGDFEDDLSVSGTLSGAFGAQKNLGLSGSVQYREREFDTVEFNTGSPLFGEFLPLDPSGNPVPSDPRFVDPRVTFPFAAEADRVFISSSNLTSTENKSENWTVTIAAEASIGSHTNLNLDVVHSALDTEQYIGSLAVRAPSSYQSRPIAELGGEERFGLVWGESLTVEQRYNYTPQIEDTTSTVSFRGESNFDRWQLKYSAGYTRGEQEIPERFDARFANTQTFFLSDPGAFILDEAIDPTEGIILSIFEPRVGNNIPFPLVNDDGLSLLNSPENYEYLNTLITSRSGENDRFSGGLSARYDFGSNWLDYIDIGVHFERSEARTRRGDASRINGTLEFDPVPNLPSADSLGIAFSESELDRIGAGPRGFLVANPGDMRVFLSNVVRTAETNDRLVPLVIPATDADQSGFTRETEIAPYVQGRISVGDFEFIGGIRVSNIEIVSEGFQSPAIIDDTGTPDLAFAQAFARPVQESVTQTEVLPRFLVNYRPTKNTVIRGAYFKSIARPQIRLLSDDTTITLDERRINGPLDNQPGLFISSGNPDLQPAITNNYDFSAEYYFDEIGVIKFGAFYKDIDNFIEGNETQGFATLDGVTLPDDPRFTNLPGDVFISGSRPQSSETGASIWGIEVAIERQLPKLPGVFSGLGVFANYTYTESERTQNATWFNRPVFDTDGVLIDVERVDFTVEDARFSQQPQHSGTAAVTYNRFSVDASLAYTWQDARRTASRFEPFFQNTSEEDFGTLDFRADYFIGSNRGTYRLFFEASDILRGTSDPVDERFIFGDARPAVHVDSRFRGGRRFTLGLAATF